MQVVAYDLALVADPIAALFLRLLVVEELQDDVDEEDAVDDLVTDEHRVDLGVRWMKPISYGVMVAVYTSAMTMSTSQY